jgi:hypothetical protein
MSRQALLQGKQGTTRTISGAPLLQRKCACGNHTTAGAECTECRKSENNLQREHGNQNVSGAAFPLSGVPVMQAKLAVGASIDPLELEADRIADQVLAAPANPAFGTAPLRIQRFTGQSTAHTDMAPGSVDRVLAGPGSRLTPPLQQDMEQRFGHDFSNVRVHSGSAAEQSARDVNANAYTAGNNIVFGAGQFAPETHGGRRLIAHELTHVVQQTNHRGLQGQTIPNGNIHKAPAEATATDGATPTALRSYLAQLDRTNKIEDFSDSDDKARDVVAAWKAGKLGVSLTPKLKTLLIKEMQSGFTGDDDEEAILDLLERAPNSELSEMFGAGKLDSEDLLSDFHGEEEDRLLLFFDTRFEGKSKAALKGSTKLVPRAEFFGKEQAVVRDAKEAAEARTIIQDIKAEFGIDVNSAAGIDAIKKQYDAVPEAVTKSLKARPWTLEELRALRRALAHYAPILGTKRAASTRAKADQEVTSTGKVEQAVDTNTAAGALDTTTLGEYFKDSKNFDMFKAGENASGDFPGDIPKQLEGTAVHEIGHGLLGYAATSFVATFKYWKSTYLADADPAGVAKKSVEAPPSAYGAKSANEDLSETAMFFFVDAARLKSGETPAKPKGTPGNPCPGRFSFMEKLIQAWNVKGKKAK